MIKQQTTLQRWLKFSVVGVFGVLFQLAALVLLRRVLPGHLIVITAMALEATLLLNFAGHRLYTWRDRTEQPLRQFLRFQVSNGFVSLAGNLTLTPWLIRRGHMPLAAANLAAILVCSAANFSLAHVWAFAGNARADAGSGVRLGWRQHLLFLLALMFLNGGAATAQTPGGGVAPLGVANANAREELPSAPRPQVLVQQDSNDSYISHVGFLCGIGASTSQIASKPSAGCGAGMSLVPVPLFVEVGVMAPQANRSYLSGYVSVDMNVPLAPAKSHYLPSFLIGYSRLFETGHAIDYGLALALPVPGKADNTRSLRVELRDYWTFANPTQHNVMLRMGWMSVLTE